jgi:hypothetical protein
LDNPVEEMPKDMTDIEKVFVMDHDFVCVSRNRQLNEELEQNYERGL